MAMHLGSKALRAYVEPDYDELAAGSPIMPLRNGSVFAIEWDPEFGEFTLLPMDAHDPQIWELAGQGFDYRDFVEGFTASGGDPEWACKYLEDCGVAASIMDIQGETAIVADRPYSMSIADEKNLQGGYRQVQQYYNQGKVSRIRFYDTLRAEGYPEFDSEHPGASVVHGRYGGRGRLLEEETAIVWPDEDTSDYAAGRLGELDAMGWYGREKLRQTRYRNIPGHA